MDPLTPAALLQFVYDQLKPWTDARKGLLSLAGDPGYVLEALADGPATFRVILAWAGDEDQTGGIEQAGIVTNQFEVWLIKAKGMQLDPGLHLIKGELAFLALLGDLRQTVRAIRFPEEVTNEIPLYKGAKQFEPELALQLPTTGYKMTFELIAAIPYLVLS